MNSQILSSRADLEHAEALLREVLVRDFESNSTGDAGSLARMLVHVVNIHHAVSTSPERLSNAAKRLGDFAVVTARMTTRNPDAAPNLNRLAHALRTASERLTELAN
jgi:hypothetical protein